MHGAYFCAGMGVGAGLMYLMDPELGRRRRTVARDKMTSMAHEAYDAAHVVQRDVMNRAHGLAAGDFSVLADDKRALMKPWNGGWSPTTRALMAGIGGGLFLFGLTQRAPTACILGTAGLALAAEDATNLGVDDIQQAASCAMHKAQSMAGSMGIGSSAHHDDHHHEFEEEDEMTPQMAL